MAGAAQAKSRKSRRGGSTAKGRATGSGRASGSGWMGGIACGALLAMSPALALLLAVLLLPGWLAWLLDRSPGRSMGWAVLCSGGAAASFPLLSLWRHGAALHDALDLLSDPTALSIAWLAGAFGWSMTVLLPLAIELWLKLNAGQRAARLRAERRRYAAAWDLPEGPAA